MGLDNLPRMCNFCGQQPTVCSIPEQPYCFDCDPNHVFITIVHHKHGRDVYTNKTEAGGIVALSEYVIENWQDSHGEEIPFKPKDAIEMYFDAEEDAARTMFIEDQEWYESDWYFIGE